MTFCFIETGTNFIKDGRLYRLPDKRVQSEMAYKSGVSFQESPYTLTCATPGGSHPGGSPLCAALSGAVPNLRKPDHLQRMQRLRQV